MSENSRKGSPPLPGWIPRGAKGVYRTVYRNGGYSDQRRADTLEKLFHSVALEKVWSRISALGISPDGWSFLIGSIIEAIACAPPRGKRATRTAPDMKIEILKRQAKADRLRAAAAKKARELSDLLADIEDNKGEMPGEVYSGLGLIETAIQSDGMSRATCAEPFENFRRGLSSYADGHFPHPVIIIEELARALEDFPQAGDIFEDNPWLASSHSSWKDCVRVLLASLGECKRMYGAAPQFSEAELTTLLQTLIDPALTRQTVSKGMKEM